MPKIKISTGSQGYTCLAQRLGNNLHTELNFFNTNSYSLVYFYNKRMERIWTLSHFWLSGKEYKDRRILDRRFLSPEEYLKRNKLIRGIEKWV